MAARFGLMVTKAGIWPLMKKSNTPTKVMAFTNHWKRQIRDADRVWEKDILFVVHVKELAGIMIVSVTAVKAARLNIVIPAMEPGVDNVLR